MAEAKRSPFFVPIKNSVATLLLRKVFLLYVLVTCLLTAGQLINEYISTHDKVTRSIASLETVVSEGLAAAIYNVDDLQIRTIVNGMLETPELVGVRVETEFQGAFEANSLERPLPFAAPAFGENGMLLNVEGTGERDSLFWNTFPIMYMESGGQPYVIGALTLFSSENIVLSEVWEDLIIILVNALIKAVALWVIFLWFARKILSRPLEKLTSATAMVSMDNLESIQVAMESDSRNELTVLAEAFNAMLANLLVMRKESERLAVSLQDASRQIEEYSWSLEDKVEERTRQLDEKNAELQVAIDKLQKAKEQAESATRSKSQFLATMSHEIRTPMNVILGMAEVLTEAELSREQQENVKVLRQAGEGLMELINDILDLSKVESGQFMLEHIEFDLQKVVDKTLRSLAVRAHEKGLEIGWRLAPHVPHRLKGDPTRLRQVLINLIGNAVKFTERGEVILEVNANPDSMDPGNLLFTVRDSGIGVPPSLHGRIFETFSQADSSTTRKFGGTGLGLAICRHLVSLMGGHIGVESDGFSGSIFSFTANFEVCSRQLAKTKGAKTVAGKRVLVVEPHVFTRSLLHEYLEDFGAAVEVLGSLEGAAVCIRELAAQGRPVELVVTVLPNERAEVGGQSVASYLGALVDEGVRRSVLLCTLGCGVGAVPGGLYYTSLVKPIAPHSLAEALDEVLASKAEPEEPASHAMGDGRALRILLVDDSPNNRMVVELFLRRTPHELVMAENGQDGVDRFANEFFDVVLMDIEMPVMDGLTATSRIRELERQRGGGQVPVIALTAHALEEEKKRAFDAGCTGFLTKPVHKNVLLTELSQL
ncbi:ATP-binding protein [Desulfovibrio mangrovi]|uniref:hybrid sensor histidine kinase/response regulator n=1 Tax=Desulfovibrio mangrovi TaxID=2976983 RepID=UPI00224553D9|nr:ATP-binding protein [Desulfovibrio mangrovi]UZP67960.1 ATP-binding protein [Desulfovibrio mangrovi]